MSSFQKVGMRLACLALTAGIVGAGAPGPSGPSRAADDQRQEETFRISHTPANAGREVFLLGSLPELGADDVRRAVRMVAQDGSGWELTVSLPLNRTYSYRYVERASSASFLGDRDNGVFLSPVLYGKTRRVADAGKSIQLHTALDEPFIYWRQGDEPFRRRRLTLLGAGRSASERRFGCEGLGRAGEVLEFFFTDAQARRDPGVENFVTPLERMFIQDGAVFSYVPAASVGPVRRAYAQGSPPSIFSQLLGRSRIYRVMLPRGYDQHVERRYPVLYLYDGDVMWDAGGQSWDRNARSFRESMDAGVIGEMILVAVDPEGSVGCSRTGSRVRDTVSPEDTVFTGCNDVMGAAETFVGFIATELKPLIDASFRTRPEREFTFASGGSLGGVYALYSGWEFPEVFGAIAAQSGSFWVRNFPARVLTEPKRDIRIYLDFGDQEGAAITDTVRAVRDGLLAKSPGYVIADDLWLQLGLRQPHNFPSFGRRLRPLMKFLYPARSEPGELVFAVVNERRALTRQLQD